MIPQLGWNILQANPPNTTLRIPVIKNDRQHKSGIDPSLIDVIVSSTVAAHGYKSLGGRPIGIDGHFPYSTVEAKTPLKCPC